MISPTAGTAVDSTDKVHTVAMSEVPYGRPKVTVLLLGHDVASAWSLDHLIIIHTVFRRLFVRPD